MPSSHLICCPLLLPPSIFPSIRVFSKESALRIRWPLHQGDSGKLPFFHFPFVSCLSLRAHCLSSLCTWKAPQRGEAEGKAGRGSGADGQRLHCHSWPLVFPPTASPWWAGAVSILVCRLQWHRVTVPPDAASTLLPGPPSTLLGKSEHLCLLGWVLSAWPFLVPLCASFLSLLLTFTQDPGSSRSRTCFTLKVLGLYPEPRAELFGLSPVSPWFGE